VDKTKGVELSSGGNHLSYGVAEHQPPQFLKQIDFENEKEVKKVL
jgi:hypothetical protein